MTHALVFDYVKLFVDNLWVFMAISAIVWLVSRPGLLERISSVKLLEFEVQLREVKAELQSTKTAVKEISAQAEEYRAALDDLDMNADVGVLRRTQQSIKALATRLTGDEFEGVRKGFEKGASPDEVHGAALVARARRDPALFDDVVGSLETIAASPNLEGRRLNTVWQLASAVHLTLVAVFKHGRGTAIDRTQLERAREVLQRLRLHPSVQADRPRGDPSKGIQGPVGHALRWIETALAERGTEENE